MMSGVIYNIVKCYMLFLRCNTFEILSFRFDLFLEGRLLAPTPDGLPGAAHNCGNLDVRSVGIRGEIARGNVARDVAAFVHTRCMGLA